MLKFKFILYIMDLQFKKKLDVILQKNAVSL